jgi:hypothetical protein
MLPGNFVCQIMVIGDTCEKVDIYIGQHIAHGY